MTRHLYTLKFPHGESYETPDPLLATHAKQWVLGVLRNAHKTPAPEGLQSAKSTNVTRYAYWNPDETIGQATLVRHDDVPVEVAQPAYRDVSVANGKYIFQFDSNTSALERVLRHGDAWMSAGETRGVTLAAVQRIMAYEDAVEAIRTEMEAMEGDPGQGTEYWTLAGALKVIENELKD